MQFGPSISLKMLHDLTATELNGCFICYQRVTLSIVCYSKGSSSLY
jgi:hypothetical protein